MTSNSLNPYCGCKPCCCAPPCTCNLTQVEAQTATGWDAGKQELRHTVTSVYRPDPTALMAPPVKTPTAGHTAHAFAPVISVAAALGQSAEGPLRKEAVLRTYETERAAAHGERHDSQAHASIRTAQYKGHVIRLKTSYEVQIDGEPLGAHMGVSDDGNVHYHGLPNYTTASALELMKQVIDAFPDDFPALTSKQEMG